MKNLFWVKFVVAFLLFQVFVPAHQVEVQVEPTRPVQVEPTRQVQVNPAVEEYQTEEEWEEDRAESEKFLEEEPVEEKLCRYC